jgi:sterol 22-desaturase
VPANSMVIPSFFNSLHDPSVFPDPGSFIPERWLEPDSLANSNPKNYLVWGSGPHKCIGMEYATMNIALVLGIATVMFDWEHAITPESNKIEYVSPDPSLCSLLTSHSSIIATLFPRDGCRLKLTPRPRH